MTGDNGCKSLRGIPLAQDMQRTTLLAARKCLKSVTNAEHNLFVQAISIAPLQVLYYSEALPTQHGYCVRVSRQSVTGNYELRTCPRSLRGG